MKLSNSSLVLSFALFSLACSGDEGSSVESFCERWASRACNDQTVAACQASDVAACRTSQQAACEARMVGSFDDDQADACLDAVGRAYEDADLTAEELALVVRLEGDCARVLAGGVEEGGVCMEDADCDAPAGFECLIEGGDVAGTCQQPVTVEPGFSCAAPNAQCTQGFYCDGENCLAGEIAGSACTTSRQCASDAYCGAEGTCTPRLMVDAVCSTDEQCLSGFCYAAGDEEATCVSLIRLSRAEPLCDDLR